MRPMLRLFAVSCLVLSIVTLGAVLAAADQPPLDPGWPAWVQRLYTPPTEQATLGDDDASSPKWALELWHAHMGDVTLFFYERPRALPNGTIRLSPFQGATKADQWWVDWPDDGSAVIRRTVLADFQ